MAVAAGGHHSLALHDDRRVAAWGRNVDGKTLSQLPWPVVKASLQARLLLDLPILWHC
jgi:hypothetical protein